MNGKTELLQVFFNSVDKDELLCELEKLIKGKCGGYVVTPNPEILMLSFEDSEYRNILNNASLCIVDGIGVEYAARILKVKLKPRIPGVEIGDMVLSLCERKSVPVFLLGGKPGVAGEAAEKIVGSKPMIDIRGYMHEYFADDDAVVEEINNSGAEVLFVCLGAPYQEKWIASNICKLKNVKLALCLGGSLDIYSGSVARAPLIIRKCGLEWLWRGLSSRERFSRMLRLPAFIIHTLKVKNSMKR